MCVMCDILTHLTQERPIAHRDVKPSNMLIMADNSLKISDFGFAAYIDSIGNGTPTRHHTASHGIIRHHTSEHH